jgi:hypothetical protein
MSDEKAENSPVEVTSAMIEAGVKAYYENAVGGWDNPGNSQLREMVSEISKAMSRRHQASRQPNIFCLGRTEKLALASLPQWGRENT